MRTGMIAVTLLSFAIVGARDARSPFVVHEWGTYTSFQDSRGAILEGLQHETERLPDFVYSRTESKPSPFADLGDTSFNEVPRRSMQVVVELPAAEIATPQTTPSLPPLALSEPAKPASRNADESECQLLQGRCGDRHRRCNVETHCHRPNEDGEVSCAGIGCFQERRRVRGKMETPVIYFYTDDEKRVRVRVDFVGGLLTQWYPRETLADPPFGSETLLAERSALEWELDLVPATRSLPRLPRVDSDDPWHYAREVASAGIRTQGEEERYVFYRGLGDVPPAVRVTALGRGVVMAYNTQPHEIPAAFAVEMTPSGGRFVPLGALAVGEAREVDLSRGAHLPKEEAVEALDRAIHAALLEQGLYQDEATAMVRTWSETWFGAEGTRIVHLLPRPAIDAMIPLSIEPKPDTLVRAMVGRVEFLTPESEADVARDLAGFASGDRRAARSLARRGRFLEAATRAVLAQTSDREVRAGAEAVLRAYE